MKNHIKTALLLGLLSALVLSVGALLAPGHLWVFALLAIAMNAGAYFFSDRLVLRMNGARPLADHDAPELHAVVAELARAARIPTPRLYLVPGDQPNAFATGRNPRVGVVAVTEGLLRTLSAREVRGVIAHEIAHIRNRDILVSSIAAAAATIVTYLAQMAAFGAMFGGHGDDDGEASSGIVGTLVLTLIAPIAATLIHLGISRSREFLADETGARISGDPEALARALTRLEHSAHAVPPTAAPATASLFVVNPFGGARTMSRWFSTHPDTSARVARLRAMTRHEGTVYWPSSAARLANG